VGGLDQWMDTVTEDKDIAIQMKKCPKCSVPIRRNLRYSAIINTQLKDIEQVKRRVLGDSRENERKQARLRHELSSLLDLHRDLHSYDERLKAEKLSSEEINCIENILKFLNHGKDWKERLAKASSTADSETKRKLARLKNQARVLEAWLLQPRRHLSDQELHECQIEITRFDLLYICTCMIERVKTSTSENLTKELRARFIHIHGELTSGVSLTSDLETRASQIIKETEKALTGLNISESERIMIVKAMALAQGHWFKCPNGLFIYSIYLREFIWNLICISI